MTTHEPDMKRLPEFLQGLPWVPSKEDDLFYDRRRVLAAVPVCINKEGQRCTAGKSRDWFYIHAMDKYLALCRCIYDDCKEPAHCHIQWGINEKQSANVCKLHMEEIWRACSSQIKAGICFWTQQSPIAVQIDSNPQEPTE